METREREDWSSCQPGLNTLCSVFHLLCFLFLFPSVSSSSCFHSNSPQILLLLLLLLLHLLLDYLLDEKLSEFNFRTQFSVSKKLLNFSSYSSEELVLVHVYVLVVKLLNSSPRSFSFWVLFFSFFPSRKKSPFFLLCFEIWVLLWRVVISSATAATCQWWIFFKTHLLSNQTDLKQPCGLQSLCSCPWGLSPLLFCWKWQ